VGDGNKLIKNDNAKSSDETVKMLVAEEPVNKAYIDKNIFEFQMGECEACNFVTSSDSRNSIEMKKCMFALS